MFGENPPQCAAVFRPPRRAPPGAILSPARALVRTKAEDGGGAGGGDQELKV
ncbi:MAG: hypothetical protein Kow00114_25850 [Kiloniellaceae bacterium]